MSEGRAAFRIKVLVGLVILMFAALTTRLWFLQVLAAERYRTEAGENSVRFIEEPAPRGEILDRNGNVLVENHRTFDITVNRQEAGNRKDQILANLSRLTGTPLVTLERLYDDQRYYPFTPVPLVTDVEQNVALAVLEHREDFPVRAVSVQETPARKYPFGGVGAHVLGHIDGLTAELLCADELVDGECSVVEPRYEGYDPNDTVGIDGVESTFESDLRGTKGRLKFQINAAGEVLCRERISGDDNCAIGRDPALPGNNVVLALDGDIQVAVEEELENAVGKARNSGVPAVAGAAVVLDPTTGGVVAMASYPSFDPEIYEGGLTPAEAAELEVGKKNPKLQPQLNRATSGEYAPGSTFKPFVGLVALKERLATQNSSFTCESKFVVGSTTFNNWNPVDQGSMTIAGALPPSCDTIFYKLAADHFWPKFYKDGYLEGSAVSGPEVDHSLHGPELLQRGLREFGFGDYTGIDLTTGSPGRIPDQEWKFNFWYDQVRHKPGLNNVCDFNICTGDLVNMSIGQGDVLATPLQTAVAYGVIATEGKHCTPHMGLRVEDPTGKVVREIEPECEQLEGYSKSDFRYIKNGLAGVVTSGTADSVFSGFPFSDVTVWGKTGSSEVAGRAEGNTDSWFAAITKGEDKKGETHEYVVVVMVEQGGHGSETAAPLARQIIERAYGFDGSGFRVGTEASD